MCGRLGELEKITSRRLKLHASALRHDLIACAFECRLTAPCVTWRVEAQATFAADVMQLPLESRERMQAVRLIHLPSLVIENQFRGQYTADKLLK